MSSRWPCCQAPDHVCSRPRIKVCNKSILLAVFAFVSIANLLTFSLFLAPIWTEGSHKLPASAAERLRRHLKQFLLEVSTPSSSFPTRSFADNVAGRSTSSKASGNIRRTTAALLAPRLDRLQPNVWTIDFPIDSPGICDHLKTAAGSGSETDREQKNWTSVVVVISAPANFEQRLSVRETWGRALKNLFNVRLVFFVGRLDYATVNSNHTARLSKEIERHSDLVQANFTDRYDNLALKSVLMLRWATSHCPNAEFLFKVDDDVFIHPENLQRVFDHHAGHRRVIFGHLAHHWRPIRDPRSHYYVSKKTWTAFKYPDFVAGPAYAMTMDSAAALLSRVGCAPYFHLEDVYVTGLLAQVAAVRRFNQPGFYNGKVLINPCEQRGVVTSHRYNAGELRAAWDVHLMRASDAGCYETECKVSFFGLCLAQRIFPVDFYRHYYSRRDLTDAK